MLQALRWFSASGLLLVVVAVLAGCRSAETRVVASEPQFVLGPPAAAAAFPGPAERIAVGWLDGPAGRLAQRVMVGSRASGMVLRPMGPAPAEVAVFESPVLVAPSGFNEAVVSWNAEVPGGAGLRVELRVGRFGGAVDLVWSPWLYVGRAGDAGPPGGAAGWLADFRQSFAHGKVDVDYFTSPVRWEAVQLRVRAWSGSSVAPGAGGEPAGPVVMLRRLAVQLSRDEKVVAGSVTGAQGGAEPGRGRLGVPFRSQKTEQRELAGRICSPTSLAMVLAHFGIDRPVLEVSRRAWDADRDLYGNWPRNVQAAFELGAPGYVCRFTEWPQVEAVLARGQPIVASIRVARGELPAAPFPATDGHLIVIEGMDEKGDLLVLDPSVSTMELGARVYPRRDMERVWFTNAAGTAYIIERPAAAGAGR